MERVRLIRRLQDRRVGSAVSAPEYPMYRITNEKDLEDLLSDIKSQAAESRGSGGCYGVYRRGPDGRIWLAIEIHLPAKLMRRKRRSARRGLGTEPEQGEDT
jgi:hypothetical protein